MLNRLTIKSPEFRTFKRSVLIVVMLTSAACHHSARSAQDTTEASNERPLVVYRADSRRDSAMLARNVGTLVMVARSAERPTETLEGFVVSLTDQSWKVLKQFPAKSDSAITLPELAVGWHYVRVQRLGYKPSQLKVDVLAGCRTHIEAYLTPAYFGLTAVTVRRDANGKEVVVPSPPERIETSGRTTVTQCSSK